MAVHRTRLNAIGASLRADPRGCTAGTWGARRRGRGSGRGPFKRRGPLPNAERWLPPGRHRAALPTGPTFISGVCWEQPAAPHARSPPPPGHDPLSPLRPSGVAGRSHPRAPRLSAVPSDGEDPTAAPLLSQPLPKTAGGVGWEHLRGRGPGGRGARRSPFIQSTTWLGDHLLTGSIMRAMGARRRGARAAAALRVRGEAVRSVGSVLPSAGAAPLPEGSKIPAKAPLPSAPLRSLAASVPL